MKCELHTVKHQRLQGCHAILGKLGGQPDSISLIQKYIYVLEVIMMIMLMTGLVRLSPGCRLKDCHLAVAFTKTSLKATLWNIRRWTRSVTRFCLNKIPSFTIFKVSFMTFLSWQPLQLHNKEWHLSSVTEHWCKFHSICFWRSGPPVGPVYWPFRFKGRGDAVVHWHHLKESDVKKRPLPTYVKKLTR